MISATGDSIHPSSRMQLFAGHIVVTISTNKSVGKCETNFLFRKNKSFFSKNHSGFRRHGGTVSAVFQLELTQKLSRGCDFFVSGGAKLFIMIVLMHLNYQNKMYCSISISAQVQFWDFPQKHFERPADLLETVDVLGDVALDLAIAQFFTHKHNKLQYRLKS